MIRYSVVVPVYGNADTIPALLERLEQLAVAARRPDGGRFRRRRLARRLARAAAPAAARECAFASQLVAHSRNFGSFAAIRTGFAAARGEFVAAMAADLQEPAELVADLLRIPGVGRVRRGRRHAHGPRRSAYDDAAVARVLVDVPALGPSRDPGRRRRHLRMHATGRRASWSSSMSPARASSGCSTGSASAGSKCPTRDHRVHPGAAAGRSTQAHLLPRQRLLVHGRPRDAARGHRRSRWRSHDHLERGRPRRAADRHDPPDGIHAAHARHPALDVRVALRTRYRRLVRMADVREQQGPAGRRGDDATRPSTREAPP